MGSSSSAPNATPIGTEDPKRPPIVEVVAESVETIVRDAATSQGHTTLGWRHLGALLLERSLLEPGNSPRPSRSSGKPGFGSATSSCNVAGSRGQT